VVINTKCNSVWIIDHETGRHYWFVSEKDRTKYGIGKEDVPETFWLHNLHPDEWHEVVKAYEAALHDPSVLAYDVEYRFRTAAAPYYMMLYETIRFVRNRDGKVLQSVRKWRESARPVVGDMKKNHSRLVVRTRQRLVVPSTDGLIFVDIQDIMYCKALSNYTELTMTNQTVLLVSRTLKHYEDALMNHGFYRIHHSYLVNLLCVKRYVRGSGGYVIMQDCKRIDVSKRKREGFLSALEACFISAS
jgi:hypothetical protein